MKKNPVIPYGIIAILGILTMIILSFVGVNQEEQIEQAHKNGGEQQEDGGAAEVVKPEEFVKTNCISCHGADLSGGVGPSLQQVGGKYSKEELKEIVMNGIEGTSMPGLVENEAQAEAIAEWLSKKK
jgi:cytochrome c550